MSASKVMLAAVAYAAIGIISHATEKRITSPDGKLAVSVTDNSGLRYRVEMDGRPLLTSSRLGLVFGDQVVLGPGAKITGGSESQHVGTWENLFGKRRTVSDCWNQVSISLSEGKDLVRRFGLIVRIYNEGVALRYDLPTASGLGDFVLTQELTEFMFPEDHRCWAGEPSSCAENRYLERTLCALPRSIEQARGGPAPYRSVLPLLVQATGALVAIAEADLDDWAGMFVVGTGSAGVGVALAARNDGRGCVVSQVPRLSPWRALLIARTANALVNSDLIATLATPSKIADPSWVKPGVCAWDPWWTGLNPHLPEFKGVWARGDTQADKEYIDFAAEMGWEYQLVDWFWYEDMSSYEIALNLGGTNPARPPVNFARHVPHLDLPALLAHAQQRGVRLLVWLHSYDLERYGIERACAYFASLGVAGLKIDFMNSDSQETVAWYQRVIEIAARHRLLIDFHGASKPTGLARTWPNYITQEGVLGNEYNKLPGNLCTPRHTITLPFTRGLLGPMDFTPGGFINKPVSMFKIASPTEVMGTRARQLAMPVIYESPLLVLCDSPGNYRGAAGIEYYRGLPTVWDETVVPSAAISEHIAVARRSGDRWWLAAMNGETPLTICIPLDFLGAGTWTLHSYSDAPDAAERPEHVVETTREVTASDSINIQIGPAGGYAASLVYERDSARRR